MAGADPPDPARMREGIRATVLAWGRGAGQRFRRASPWAIVGALAAGAIAPVVWPLAGAADVSATVLGALMGQIGNVGAGYLVEVITKALDQARQARAGQSSPEQLREAIDTELQALINDGQGAVGLRREVASLLQAIGGVDTAVSTAVQTEVEEVQQAVLAAFADLGGSVTEFAWMLDQTRQSLIKIQDVQARQGVEQRHQTDLARENLAKINLVIQRLELLIGVPSEKPTEERATAPTDPTNEQPAPGPCPYMGLRSFRAEDAPWFFGRERLTADLVARLVEAPLLAVVGASGSGKSSLLGAGLLPAAWAGTVPGARSWTTVALTPTSHPLEELASRIALLRGLAAGGLLTDLRTDPHHLRLAIRQVLADAPTGTRLLVIIDQVEEIFTLCHDDAERQSLLDALAAVAADPGCGATVVLGIRADFYPRCTEHPALAAALQDHQLLVTPMATEELQAAITRPAQRADLVLEPGLVETILADLGKEPGALPLLSHALLATWERRQGKTLTRAAYRDAGGVRQAIGQTADTVYQAMTAAQQAIAKDIFVRLTALGEGTEDTRRRPQRTELISGRDSTQANEVIQALASARLITLDQHSVEVAHEALIREWPRLRRWLDEDREGLRLARGLTTAAHDWATSGRDESLLYRGTRLADVRAWSQRTQPRLSQFEDEFLHASITQENIEQRAKRRRAQALVAALVVTFTAFASALFLYIHQRDQSRIAIANELAAKSSSLATNQPYSSMLLAVEAFHEKPTPEALSALLSAQSQRLSGQLVGHATHVYKSGFYGVAFSPDGHALATAGVDGTVRLWDVASRQQIATLVGHSGIVSSVVFSPDGHILASAGEDNTARLWDVASRQQIATLSGHEDSISSVAFSPDGRTLATASYDGTTRLWDVRSHQQVTSLVGHKGRISGVAFSPDGQILATAGDDHTVKLWDASNYQMITSLTGHAGPVLCLAFSPDGRSLATGGDDSTVHIWNVAGRKDLEALDYESPIKHVAFSPDGRILAAAGEGLGVPLRYMTYYQVFDALTGHTDAINSMAFSPDGRTLATASADDTVKLWNIQAPILIPSYQVMGVDIATTFSPDGRILAATNSGGTVQLWDVARRQEIGSPFIGHAGNVRCVAFSPDGRTLATGGDDHTIRLWDVTSHQQIASMIGHTNLVYSVVFSPDGHTLATSSEDETARLWDVTSRHEIAVFKHTTPVGGVAFSPDGRTLATSAKDGNARLWDVASHQQVATLVGHTGAIPKLAFSPDGHTLATASYDHTARLWDVASRQPIATLTGHATPVMTLAFSPDGHTLATGSEDPTVRLWDVVSHQQTATLTSRTGYANISSVAFSPDGHTLASTSNANNTQLWDLNFGNFGQLADRICRIIGTPSQDQWTKLIPDLPYQPTCR